MNFVWWLVKRACKWTIGQWGHIWGASLWVAPIVEYLLNAHSNDFTLGTDKFDSVTWWLPVTILSWSLLAVLVGVYIICVIFEYFSKLHVKYRAEQPEREKPKRKRIEAAIDETEYFTLDWEAEIHRINRHSAEEMMVAQKRHVEIVVDLKQTHRKELFDLHERRNKEEGETDDQR